jgi:cysteinyl-tRNA synthetase
MHRLSTVLNLFGEDPSIFLNLLRTLFLKEKGLSENWINENIQHRIEARKQKDFQKADEIRNHLLSLGIELMDRGQETQWDVSFTSRPKANVGA